MSDERYAEERADRRYEIDRQRIERIAELEAQVTRMRAALLANHKADSIHFMLHAAPRLHPGDLDPVKGDADE